MNPALADELAKGAVAALTPYLVDMGKGASKIGAENKLSDLYRTIKERTKETPRADEALSDLEDAPEDQDLQASLRVQLKKLLENNPDLIEELRQKLQEARDDPQTATFLVQMYGGTVDNIIQIGRVDNLHID